MDEFTDTEDAWKKEKEKCPPDEYPFPQDPRAKKLLRELDDIRTVARRKVQRDSSHKYL